MSDSKIKVAIRCRPKIAQEVKKGLKDQWQINGNEITCIDTTSTRLHESYTFDHILDQHATNKDVYDLVKPIVASVCNGINGTIFAYGQTSSGKTHSIMGKNNDLGIIPQTIIDIFDTINAVKDRTFLVRCSYFELYREKVNDLLNKSAINLKVCEDAHGFVTVNVEETITRTKEELLNVFRIGSRNRQIGVTAMNQKSSRSHVILKIIVESSATKSEDDKTPDQNIPVKISNLFIIDLAGSERVGQTNATGTTFKEGRSINKSLSYLSLVITQLSNNEEYVNFRNSKLTRLLSNALGGNSKTLIVANITPVSVDDTISTLTFASFAKKIVNKARINECLSGALLIKRHQQKEKDLVKEIDTLKQVNIDLITGNDLKSMKIRSLEKQLNIVRTVFVCKKTSNTRRHTIHMACDYDITAAPRASLPIIVEEPFAEAIGSDPDNDGEDIDSDMEEVESDIEDDVESDELLFICDKDMQSEPLNISRFSLDDADDIDLDNPLPYRSSSTPKELIKHDILDSGEKSLLELEDFIKAEYDAKIEVLQEELMQSAAVVTDLMKKVMQLNDQATEGDMRIKQLIERYEQQSKELRKALEVVPDDTATLENMLVLTNKCELLEEGVQLLTCEKETLSSKILSLNKQIEELSGVQEKYVEACEKNKELGKQLYLNKVETVYRCVKRTTSETNCQESCEEVNVLRRCNSVPADYTRYSDFHIRDLFIDLQNVISAAHSTDDACDEECDVNTLREKLHIALDAIECKNQTISELNLLNSQQINELAQNCEHISNLERANNKLKAKNHDLIESCDDKEAVVTISLAKEADLLSKIEQYESKLNEFLIVADKLVTNTLSEQPCVNEGSEFGEKIQFLIMTLESLQKQNGELLEERERIEKTLTGACNAANSENTYLIVRQHEIRTDFLRKEQALNLKLAEQKSVILKLSLEIKTTDEEFSKSAEMYRDQVAAAEYEAEIVTRKMNMFHSENRSHESRIELLMFEIADLCAKLDETKKDKAAVEIDFAQFGKSHISKMFELQELLEKVIAERNMLLDHLLLKEDQLANAQESIDKMIEDAQQRNVVLETELMEEHVMNINKLQDKFDLLRKSSEETLQKVIHENKLLVVNFETNILQKDDDLINLKKQMDEMLKVNDEAEKQNVALEIEPTRIDQQHLMKMNILEETLLKSDETRKKMYAENRQLVSDLETLLLQKDKETNEMRIKLSEMKDIEAELQANIVEQINAQAEIKELRGNVITQRENAAIVAKLNAMTEVKDIEAKLQAKTVEQINAQIEIDTLREHVLMQRENAIRDRGMITAPYQKEIDQLEQEVEKLQCAIVAKDNAMTELRRVQEELTAQVHQLNSVIADKDAVIKGDVTMGDLNREIIDLTAALASKDLQIKKLEAARKVYKSQIKEMDGDHDHNLFTLQSAWQGMLEKEKSQRCCRESDVKKIGALKAQLSEKTKETFELRTKLEKIVILNNLIKVQSRDIEQLKEDVHAYKENEILLSKKCEDMGKLLEESTRLSTKKRRSSLVVSRRGLKDVKSPRSPTALSCNECDIWKKRSESLDADVARLADQCEELKEQLPSPSSSFKAKRQAVFDQRRDLSDVQVDCENCRKSQDALEAMQMQIHKLLEENKDLDLEANGAAHEVTGLRLVVEQMTKSVEHNLVIIQQQAMNIGTLNEQCLVHQKHIAVLREANTVLKSNVLPTETFLSMEIRRLNDEVTLLKSDIVEMTEDRDNKNSILREVSLLLNADIGELNTPMVRRSPKVLSPRESESNLIDENNKYSLETLPKAECVNCSKTKKSREVLNLLHKRITQITQFGEASNTDVLDYYKHQCGTLEKKCGVLEQENKELLKPKEIRCVGIQANERDMSSGQVGGFRTDTENIQDEFVPKEKYNLVKALAKVRLSRLQKYQEEEAARTAARSNIASQTQDAELDEKNINLHDSTHAPSTADVEPVSKARGNSTQM